MLAILFCKGYIDFIETQVYKGILSMINKCLIIKYGLYGCSESDPRMIIRNNQGKTRLVKLCQKFLSDNEKMGRD